MRIVENQTEKKMNALFAKNQELIDVICFRFNAKDPLDSYYEPT